MTTLTLTYRSVKSKVKLVNLPKINWKIIYLTFALLSLLMLIFYVFEVNKLTEGSYLIKNYNKEINNLVQENRILETNFAKTGFLKGIQKKVQELGFEKTTEVKYVQILENSFAKAR